MVKIEEEKYNKLLSENQVLKNIVKSMMVFNDSASGMSYEGYYKSMRNFLAVYSDDINNGKFIDLEIIKETLPIYEESEKSEMG